MKSTFEKSQPKENAIRYPCLMEIDDGTVVLFQHKSSGTVVYSPTDYNEGYPIGYHSEIWIMSYFTPFFGTINLANE